MKNNNSSYIIALRGMLVAAAFTLSYLEAQIPAFIPIPGIKLGISNIVVLIALYKLSSLDAFAINIVRIVLAGFTFGSLSSMLYSLAGGMLSFLIMYVFKRYIRFDIKTVSILGGISHNLGQIILAAFILSNHYILMYLPMLIISGIITGLLIGIAGSLIVSRIDIRQKS